MSPPGNSKVTRFRGALFRRFVGAVTVSSAREVESDGRPATHCSTIDAAFCGGVGGRPNRFARIPDTPSANFVRASLMYPRVSPPRGSGKGDLVIVPPRIDFGGCSATSRVSSGSSIRSVTALPRRAARARGPGRCRWPLTTRDKHPQKT